MEKKQTALKWFLQELETEMQLGNNFNKSEQRIFDEIKQEALQMEREQIEDAFKHGQNNGFMYHERGFDTISSNQFYKQTYGGQDE